MCFITLFFFSSPPSNSSLFFNLHKKSPTPRGGGNGQNIYPCINERLFSPYIPIAYICFKFYMIRAIIKPLPFTSCLAQIKVCPLGGFKWNWLTKSLVQFMSRGTVLIFVTKKQNSEELAHNLKIKAEIDCRWDFF